MAVTLYTPDVLGLATSLSQFRLDDSIMERAEVRSRSCGSSLILGLEFDSDDLVSRVGMSTQACAVGQASAAIFAQAVQGRAAADIIATASSLESWLSGDGDIPDWPHIDVIAKARDYPARHGAIMLVWNAALQILSTRTTAR